MWWWWWAWIALLFVLLVLPLSYGWGRRGWGPPYPTYYRRRYYGARGTAPVAPEPGDTDPNAPVGPMGQRVATAERTRAPEQYPGYGYSWLADLLWLGVFAAIGWAIYLWVA